jgi:MATE family multidrug resistance protein
MTDKKGEDRVQQKTDYTISQTKEETNMISSEALDNTHLTIETSKSETLENFSYNKLLCKVTSIALPGMMFYLFLILLQVLNMAFIGQKYNDDDMIKGIGVSNLYMNCTMFAIVMGIVSGIDTLCANAFAIKKYKLMGLYVHRARILGYAVTLLIVIVHFFTVEKVLRLFNLNERVISFSSKYIYVCLIYVFFDVQTACNFRLLNVIRKSHVNFFVLVIGGLLHPLWNYIFIIVLDLDVVGAGISFTLSRFVIFLCSTLYIQIWNPLPESNFWINRSCFKGLYHYFKFSIGAAFLVCAEWWAFEVQAIIAISISEDDYTVHIILGQFSSLLYSLCIGFGFSATILIGEYIAKSPVQISKKAVWFILGYGLVSMCGLLTVFYFLKTQMFKLFIDKDYIIEKGLKCIPILCLCELFDFGQTVLSSVFRGLGKNLVASGLTFVQFYLIMTSLSFLLGNILQLGVYGMWLGILCGQVSGFVLYISIFLCMDLHLVKSQVKQRIVRDHKTAKSFIEIEEKDGNLLLSNN